MPISNSLFFFTFPLFFLVCIFYNGVLFYFIFIFHFLMVGLHICYCLSELWSSN